METLSSLRKEAKTLKAAINLMKQGILLDPQVKKVQAAFQRAKEHLDYTIRKMEAESTANLVAKLKAVEAKIEAGQFCLEDGIAPTEQDKRIRMVQDLLARIQSGMDAPKLKVRWISPLGRFFILTNPGRKEVLNRWEGSQYVQSEHCLMDCEAALYGDSEDGGYRLFRNLTLESVYGRLTPKQKQNWIDLATGKEKTFGAACVPQEEPRSVESGKDVPKPPLMYDGFEL